MNTNKLKAKVVENGLTMADLAKSLHINPSTLSFKVNGKSDFNLDELRILKQLLNLTDAEFFSIFFSE